MEEVNIEYAILDPFNIAYYDMYEKKIYLDECVKGTELEKKLIEHEKKHLEKPSLFSESLDFNLFPQVLKYKPLHIFQFLFPFILGKKKDGSWIFKIDPLGLVLFIIFALSISYLVSFKTIRCELISQDLTSSLFTYKKCYECTIFGCKEVPVTNFFKSFH